MSTTTRWRLLTVALMGALLATGAVADSTLTKPSVFTNPVKYLKTVPLGQVSLQDAMAILGLPDKTAEIGGKSYLSFEVGEGLGRRQFVYEFTDGKLTDVRFNQSGPYNGASALDLQSKKDK